MRKLSVSIIAAVSLSGCASTGVDKPDLLGTLAFCAGQSLTPEHAERQLPLLGWTPQKESNTALELVFWTSFGRDYVSNTYPFTDESFGELVAGAYFIAGSTLGNSGMSPDQPSYTNGPYKLTTLALDVGSGHCIVSAPHLFNDVFIAASRKHQLNLEFIKNVESRGVAVRYFSMPQNGQVITMTFDAAKLRGVYSDLDVVSPLSNESLDLQIFDRIPRSIVTIIPSFKGDRLLEQEQDTDDPEANVSATPIIGLEHSSIDEMHMVGVYEPYIVDTLDGEIPVPPDEPLARDEEQRAGFNQSSGFGTYVREDVVVNVDRPGKSIALVLGSVEPVRWRVNTSQETTVIFSYLAGADNGRSELILNGEQVIAEFLSIPPVFNTNPPLFQKVHSEAANLFGVKKASSFHGSYRAPENGFSITDAPGVATQEEIDRELYKIARDPQSLSPQMQAALNRKSGDPGNQWTFDENGFVGFDEGGVAVQYAIPLDLPSVSWPVGAAFDFRHKRLFGVSFGGQGFLYRYDIEENQWSAMSMNNVDVDGIYFDSSNGLLILTTQIIHADDHEYLMMDIEGNSTSRVRIPLSDYPGLTDTFAMDNGPSLALIPLVVEGDEILIRVINDKFGDPHVQKDELVYLVHLGTKTVELVR